MLAFISDTGVVVAVIAFVALFGASQIPKLARNLGEAGREFRKAHAELVDPAAALAATAANAATAAAAPNAATAAAAPNAATAAAAPNAGTAATAPTLPATPAHTDDRVTLTRAQFDALLATPAHPAEYRS